MTPPGQDTNPRRLAPSRSWYSFYRPHKDGKLSQLWRKEGHTNVQHSAGLGFELGAGIDHTTAPTTSPWNWFTAIIIPKQLTIICHYNRIKIKLAKLNLFSPQRFKHLPILWKSRTRYSRVSVKEFWRPNECKRKAFNKTKFVFVVTPL